MRVEFELFESGYCMASKAHALRGARREQIRFYATWGLIQHPAEGYILFDTGYTDRFYTHTRRWPYSLYAKMTPVFVRNDEEVVARLAQKKIAPEEIAAVIVSHFHADHIGGLRDFPAARFICDRKAYEAVAGRRGFSAVRRGFLPDLLPDDFRQRVEFIDFQHATIHDQELGRLYDLFGDGTIRLCELDGHATGQLGALLDTGTQKIFLVADAAWLKENYQKMHLPSPLIRTFIGSWSAYKDALLRIHRFHKAHPEVVILPCHCEASLRSFQQ